MIKVIKVAMSDLHNGDKIVVTGETITCVRPDPATTTYVWVETETYANWVGAFGELTVERRMP